MAQPARLIVLGSGTAVPLAGRATSCYLVDAGDGRALCVDLGPGALHRAAQAGYPLGSLSGAFLTHIHPDHSADLVSLQFALRSPSLPLRPEAFQLFGHAEVALLVARLRNAWPGWLGLSEKLLRFSALSPGPVSGRFPPGVTVEAFRVAHHATSLGYRFTLPDGFVLAFSGDAREGEALVELGQRADLFVLEAAGTDQRPIPGHLTPRRAGRIAAQAQARHLLLTHFYPETLAVPIQAEAQEAFEGRVTLAEDGSVLTLAR
ncbi:MAG: MBL fold metallo-hydrolase [Planctomycetota bacterium]